MVGRTNAGNGGSVNVSVVGAATRPTNPKNNTIWVETSTAITGWEIGYKHPAAPAEGNVFILANGASSVADFEITGSSGRARNQVVKISPAYAYQYINGAWVNKVAKLYVNDGWLDTLTILYDRGTYGGNFAHGWSSGEQSASVEVSAEIDATVTSLSNGAADLTGISTVEIEYSGNTVDTFGSEIKVQIVNQHDTMVLKEKVHGQDETVALTKWSVDVTTINELVRFKLSAKYGFYQNPAVIRLFSIKLIPGNPV